MSGLYLGATSPGPAGKPPGLQVSIIVQSMKAYIRCAPYNIVK
jgi:hypothetical protein